MFFPDDDESEFDWPPAPKMEHIEYECSRGRDIVHFASPDFIAILNDHDHIEPAEESSESDIDDSRE